MVDKRLHANRDKWLGIVVVGTVDMGVGGNFRVHVGLS